MSLVNRWFPLRLPLEALHNDGRTMPSVGRKLLHLDTMALSIRKEDLKRDDRFYQERWGPGGDLDGIEILVTFS